MKACTTELLNSYFDRYDFMAANRTALCRSVDLLTEGFHQGKKLLLCGNGGSCADADHIVGELVKSFRIARPLDAELLEKLLDQPKGALLAEKLQQGLPAINLCAQTSLMTAMINDVGGEYVFAQQVMAYGAPGDFLLGISTSGNSKNILYAADTARALGMTLIGLTGRSGGKMAGLFDIVLCAQADETENIQDQHTTIYHALCAALECEFWGK